MILQPTSVATKQIQTRRNVFERMSGVQDTIKRSMLFGIYTRGGASARDMIEKAAGPVVASANEKGEIRSVVSERLATASETLRELIAAGYVKIERSEGKAATLKINESGIRYMMSDTTAEYERVVGGVHR